MSDKTVTLFETAFENEVHQGLTDYPKHLSSKYFYDVKGDALFQDIMNMPEYYLTDAEYAIFAAQKNTIAALFAHDRSPFDLVELGAGDGKKTKVLLAHFMAKNIDFRYMPIDISINALDQLESALRSDFPNLNVIPVQGTYFEALAQATQQQKRRKVILFLGSNIGNLLHDQAIDFLKNVQDLLTEDDLFFVGFDQKKNPQTILDAYNDPTGITEAFNKNILARINSELGGNFDLDTFLHWEVYDPESGTAKSYLVSRIAQSVTIERLGLKIDFDPWETIHTEISQKYDDRTVSWLAAKSGLEVVAQFTDTKQQYKNYVFKKRTLV